MELQRYSWPLCAEWCMHACRRYLIHLAQEAEIIGILVGTVGIRDWQTQLNSVKELAHASGKKSYTFFLGKTPTPEKLANFPEVRLT